MSTNANLPTILWLDPLQPLGDQELIQLQDAGLQVQRIQTLDELQAALGAQPPARALVIRHDPAFDLQTSAQALFQQVGDSLPLICRVERQQMDLAVSAMRQGAAYALASDDFSASSWQTALDAAHTQIKGQAVQAMTKVLAKQRSRQLQPAPAAQTQRKLVYVDPISRHLLALAQRVAQADVTALIEGPTGAGKEILARVLHESSNRAHGPFVGLNCAALPEQLIDDMLFGHEKGAFTGAQKDLRGLFEQAQGGTLFLDEIGEMPLHLQAKLLRVLQERQLTRLGSEQLVQVDVRVIAATNKDLRAAMAAREFREDLYFRISTFKLHVPPLRQRPGDILPLVAALLLRHGGEGRQLTVSAQAQAQLLAYGWPGNVRELENVVQRAVVLCQTETIEPQHLMFDDLLAPAKEPALLSAADQPSISAAPANTAPSSAPAYSSVPNPSSPADAAATFATAPLPVAGALAQAEVQAQFHPEFHPQLQPQYHPQVQAKPYADLAEQIRALPAANLQAAVKSNELQLILAAIQSSDSRIEAAKKLGISPRTLRYKLAKIKAEPGKNNQVAPSAALTPTSPLVPAPMAFALAG